MPYAFKNDPVIDAAIEKLAEIQDRKRKVLAEELELKEMVKGWVTANGAPYDQDIKYVLPTGHGITLYTQVREQWDEEYLRKVLTSRQIKRAVSEKVSNCVRFF